MKYRRFLETVIFVIVLSIFSNMQVYAAVDTTIQKNCTAALANLGLMHANSKGNMLLNNKMKRCEFIALVNATMSYDIAADSKNVKISFKDITSKHWAYNDIKAAAAHGIISAYDDNTIRPDRYITDAEALDIVLKALGYRDAKSDKAADSILDTSVKTGLSNNCVLTPNTQLTRGEAAIIIYNALTIDFA